MDNNVNANVNSVVNVPAEKEDTIDIIPLLEALLKNIWLIILGTLVIASCVGLYSAFFITPKYTAETTMYVNATALREDSTGVNSSDLTTAQKLVDTYIVILQSRDTLELAAERAGLDYGYSAMSNMVTASSVNNTEVFKITVTSTNGKESEILANTLAQVLIERINTIMGIDAVEIVEYAVEPNGKSSPNNTKNAIIGGLIGAFLCCAVIVIKELIDTKIHSEDYLLKQYPNIPLLAVIPMVDDGTDKSGYVYGKVTK